MGRRLGRRQSRRIAAFTERLQQAGIATDDMDRYRPGFTSTGELHIGLMVTDNDDQGVCPDILCKVVSENDKFVIEGAEIGLSSIFEIRPGDRIEDRLQIVIDPAVANGLPVGDVRRLDIEGGVAANSNSLSS